MSSAAQANQSSGLPEQSHNGNTTTTPPIRRLSRSITELNIHALDTAPLSTSAPDVPSANGHGSGSSVLPPSLTNAKSASTLAKPWLASLSQSPERDASAASDNSPAATAYMPKHPLRTSNSALHLSPRPKSTTSAGPSPSPSISSALTRAMSTTSNRNRGNSLTGSGSGVGTAGARVPTSSSLLNLSELAHQDLADASNGFGSSSSSSTSAHVPLNPADRKRVGAWMTCFCVVGFDLEMGQALEHVYPPVAFSEAEQRTIRFNSFPDSNSFLHGDITFSFTIRRPPGSSPLSCTKQVPLGTSPPPDEPPTSSFRPRTASLSVPIPTMDDEYLFASVFFRQQPDPKIRRGYYQKSVVLISSLPLPGLWDRVIRLVGPVLFDLGLPALEAAVNNIAKWPPPSPGMHDLPLLGSVMQVHIPALPPTPATVQLLPLSAKTLGPLQILAMTLPNALYPTFCDTLDHLWTLWELVLANEPIAVISSCPSVTSRAVEALAALVRPVPVERTYRPYLTIQDPDFRYFTKNHPPPRTILGVTNPHFHSALDRWPHVLQIGPPRTPLGKPKGPAAVLTSLDIAQGLTTKYKRVVARDVKLLAQLAQLTLEGAADVVLDNLLRRHFADLTDMFLAPLAKYVTTLWPASLALSSPYPIQPATFRADAFLATLAPASSNPLSPPPPAPFPVRATATRWLPSGSDDWIDLYRNFLRTPQFAAWLEHRLAVDAHRWAEQYMALVCATDLARWWAGVCGGPTGRGNKGGRRSAVADVEGKVLRARIAYLLGEENEWRPSPTQAVRLQAQLEALIELISKSS